MKEVEVVKPNLGGWLTVELDDTEMKFLWDCIENPRDNFKKYLAGNIRESRLLLDKDNWLFDNVLYKLCSKYADEFGNQGDLIPTTGKHPYYLNTLWVNYQRQTEFNPLHDHTGVYSFVIWMKIPTYYFEQRRDNKFALLSNARCISNFEFQYLDILGRSDSFIYEMSPKLEGTLVFFPSQMQHQVYPFYNCEEERISISGNISLDTRELLE